MRLQLSCAELVPARMLLCYSTVSKHFLASAAVTSATPGLMTCRWVLRHKQQLCSVESLLSGILHFRVQHHMQQLALVRSLDLLLQQHPQVGHTLLWQLSCTSVCGAELCFACTYIVMLQTGRCSNTH
jgi:hypothetical protein